jgi:hypothetical protein
MTTTTTFDCVAERELEYRATPDAPIQKAIVRIGRPYFVPPPTGQEEEIWGHWVGAFEIEVEGIGTRSEQAEGMDGVQALQLAMFRVGLALRHLYPGEFTIGGGGDPGFPTSTK